MKKGLYILISVLLLSCNSDETIAITDKTAITLVTGVNLRETFDDPSFKLGNPNVLVNDKFVIYPNPAIKTANIVAQENISDVWIVPASPEKTYQDVDFSSILNINLYSEESVISNSNVLLNGQSSNNLHMNISSLEKGYYRVFVKIGGEIYWDNFYKYGNQDSAKEQLNSMIDFWE